MSHDNPKFARRPPGMFLEGLNYDPEMSIDLRHRDWLYTILSTATLKRTLEIGSGEGVSASAFFAAQESGAQFEAHFCDYDFRPAFHAVVARRTVVGRVVLHEISSQDFIRHHDAQEFDLVLVDGDHSREVVQAETEWLLRSRPRIVLAHDTTCRIRGSSYDWCDGPEYLKWAFQDAGYLILEDSQCREGEFTDRGMLAAARDPGDYHIMLAGFRQCCRSV